MISTSFFLFFINYSSFEMICLISAIVFAQYASGLHILPCEPGEPGPLGCDQFVANGGQLGTAAVQTNVVDPTQSTDLTAQFVNQNVPFIGPTTQMVDPNLQFIDPITGMIDPNIQLTDHATQGIDPNLQFIDPSTQMIDPNLQMIDPNLQMIDPNLQMIDPNLQFIDPTSQRIDPNLQFIDHTQIIEPTSARFVGIEQPRGPPFFSDVGVVGRKTGASTSVYPKGSKVKIKGFSKSPLKKNSMNVYPKAISKMKVFKGYMKIPNTYSKGKLSFYNKIVPILLLKSQFGKLKLYVLPGYAKVRNRKKYVGYPIGGSRYLTYLGNPSTLYPTGNRIKYINSKKFHRGY